MLVARKALGLTRSLVGQNGFQLRTSVISGPPRHQVPAMEKLALCLIISAGVCATPAWILVNLQSYKGGEDN